MPAEVADIEGCNALAVVALHFKMPSAVCKERSNISSAVGAMQFSLGKAEAFCEGALNFILHIRRYRFVLIRSHFCILDHDTPPKFISEAMYSDIGRKSRSLSFRKRVIRAEKETPIESAII